MILKFILCFRKTFEIRYVKKDYLKILPEGRQ